MSESFGWIEGDLEGEVWMIYGWFKLKKMLQTDWKMKSVSKIMDESMFIIPPHHAARTPYSVGEPPNWQELRKPVLEPLHGPSASA